MISKSLFADWIELGFKDHQCFLREGKCLNRERMYYCCKWEQHMTAIVAILGFIRNLNVLRVNITEVGAFTIHICLTEITFY